MQHGDLPQRHKVRQAPTDLLTARGEDLTPLRMEPPSFHEGLRPAAFSDGLDELSVDGIRSQARTTKWRGVGEEAALTEARRRATGLDHALE